MTRELHVHPQTCTTYMYGHFQIHQLCIFQVQLKKYGYLKSTRPVACKSEVVGRDVGVAHAWVCQEEGETVYELFAFFFTLIHSTKFPDPTF